MDIETSGQRLEQIKRLIPDLTNEKIAEWFGVSTQAVQKWTVNKIPSNRIKEIAERTGVSEEWLVLGKGKPFPDENHDYRDEVSVVEQTPKKSIAGVIGQYDEASDTHIEIERYDVQLAAGTGTAVWIVRKKNDDPILFRKGWYKARRLNPENLRGMYVRGDSMEPYLFNRDTVLIDISDTEISDGEVYAIVFKNRFYVKELRAIEGGIRIISRNEKYEPMEMLDKDWQDERDFQVLGHVVWRGGR